MFYYRIVSTGEVLGAGQSAPQDDDWKARYATALGITEPIAEFESATDPRKADAKREPAPPPTPEPEPAAPTFEELVAQASTFAELKRLVAENLA